MIVPKPTARRVILKGLAAGMIFSAWWLLYFTMHKVSPEVYESGNCTDWINGTQILAILLVVGVLCIRGSRKWGWSILVSVSFFWFLRLAVIPRLPGGHDFLHGDFLFISELPEVRMLGYRRVWICHWIAAADIILIRFIRRDRMFDNASKGDNSFCMKGILGKSLCLSLIYTAAFFLSRCCLTVKAFSSSLIYIAFPLWALSFGCAVLCINGSYQWRKSLVVGFLLSVLIAVPLAIVPLTRRALIGPELFMLTLPAQVFSCVDKLTEYAVFNAVAMIVIRCFVFRNEVAEDVLDWWNYI